MLRWAAVALLALLAGCRDDDRDCEDSCRDRYEDCVAEGPGPACDVAYDDCLDGCYGTGARSAGSDGGWRR